MTNINTAILDIVSDHIETQFSDAKNAGDIVSRTQVTSLFEDFKAELNKYQPEGGVSETKVRQIFQETFTEVFAKIPPKKIEINVDGSKAEIEGEYVHSAFDEILIHAACGKHIILVGPAGSGKSWLVQQVARALNRGMVSQGPASSEYKYLGYNDAYGKLVITQLHNAFANGLIFNAEEIDASGATALVAGLNMALANGVCDFGNEMVSRHKDFLCIATANTWLTGADRSYVGRNQIDASTISRFAMVEVGYDEDLERNITQLDSWVDFVQSVRKACFDLNIRHVVSPRASINGADVIKAGMDPKMAANAYVWQGLSRNDREKIDHHING